MRCHCCSAPRAPALVTCGPTAAVYSVATSRPRAAKQVLRRPSPPPPSAAWGATRALWLTGSSCSVPAAFALAYSGRRSRQRSSTPMAPATRSRSSHILAGRRRLSVQHTLGREILPKRRGHTLARPRIVHVERVAVKRRDLRLARRARRLCLCIHDAFDGRQHALAHASVERAHVELDDSLVRNSSPCCRPAPRRP